MNSTISRTWSFAVAVLLSAVLLWAGSASALTMITAHLDFGATGGNVTSLQQFLAADASIYPEGLVTGYFGSLTRAAVNATSVSKASSVAVAPQRPDTAALDPARSPPSMPQLEAW